MRRGWKAPVLCLVASTRSSFGFATSRNNINHKRRMSSEVMTNESFEKTEQSWRLLLETSINKSRKIRGSNYVQLATANKDGEPRCRTVVFRGFLNNLPTNHTMAINGGYCDDKPCVMKMCTDLRSKKVEEVAKGGEMVWWFPKTSEQYRVRGSLLLIGGENDDRALQIARKELWGNLNDAARESFLNGPIMNGGRDEEGKVVPPPKNFLLMLLDPIYVDYLLLKGAQYRQIDQRHDDNNSQSYWSFKEVDP
mmetsp:Transcript_59518/g.66622  ORF Transcript_59518/g.66622 Transcript_59518/m.66622 type:complete len:252 (-) Transcript_59518:36-791(-)